MKRIRSLTALLAGGVLIVAACAGPGEEQPFTPAPQPQETPAANGMSPDPGNGMSPEPGNGMSPEPGNGMSPEPGNGMSPEPGNDDMTPEPGNETTPEPGAEVSPEPGAEVSPEPGAEVSPEPGNGQAGLTQGQAVAVINHAGSLHILGDGQCTFTAADNQVGQQMGSGQTLELSFQQAGTQPGEEQPGEEPGTEQPGEEPGTEQPGIGQQGSLTLTLQLARGLGEPGTGQIGAEHLLPIPVMPEQVEMQLDLDGQQQLTDPQVQAGLMAPNGLSGYIVAQAEQDQLLTINFVCAEMPATDGPGIGDEPAPAESPEPAEPTPGEATPGETPATEPSPAPSP